jgi:hypothetical protein
LDGLSTSQETLNPRQANPDDIEYLVYLARGFHDYSIWRDAIFDSAAVRDLATALVLQGGVFLTDSGFIAGTIVSLPFSPNVRVATELAWYAPNGGGRELRSAFEQWGRDMGATLVQFSALADDKVDMVHDNMIKNGFNLAELQYLKRL